MKRVLLVVVLALAGLSAFAQEKMAIVVYDVRIMPTKDELEEKPAEFFKAQGPLEANLAANKLIPALGPTFSLKGKSVTILPPATVRAALLKNGLVGDTLERVTPAILCELLGTTHVIVITLVRSVKVEKKRELNSNPTPNNRNERYITVTREFEVITQKTQVFRKDGVQLLIIANETAKGGKLQASFDLISVDEMYTKWARQTGKELNDRFKK
jgi:hypothetical protein